jgi:hypothetical protein
VAGGPTKVEMQASSLGRRLAEDLIKLELWPHDPELVEDEFFRYFWMMSGGVLSKLQEKEVLGWASRIFKGL